MTQNRKPAAPMPEPYTGAMEWADYRVRAAGYFRRLLRKVRREALGPELLDAEIEARGALTGAYAMEQLLRNQQVLGQRQALHRKQQAILQRRLEDLRQELAELERELVCLQEERP